MKVLSSINSSFITEDHNSQGNLYEIASSIAYLMGTFLFFIDISPNFCIGFHSNF